MKDRTLRTAVVVTAAAAFGIPATAAFAAHESNNLFDLKPVGTVAPQGDGRGVSTYLAGASSEDNELWNSRVRVTGLPAGVYTLWAENNNDTFEPTTPATLAAGQMTDFAICTFTVKAKGTGTCKARKHNEPALARVRVRQGTADTFGAAVLEALRTPADADRKVDDGEIESRGGNRAK